MVQTNHLRKRTKFDKQNIQKIETQPHLPFLGLVLDRRDFSKFI